MTRSLVPILFAVVATVAACSSQQVAQPQSAAQTPVATPAVAPVAAAQSVAELPDYPGAMKVASSQVAEVEHGFARKAEASWTSTDAYATVVAYYQKAIADNGWTITENESKATEAEWRLAKGTSVGKVEVKQAVGRPVTIKIERSDR
jgi:hypothetical protein